MGEKPSPTHTAVTDSRASFQDHHKGEEKVLSHFKKGIVKIQKNPKPRVTLEFGC